jgi:hypothetical protein
MTMTALSGFRTYAALAVTGAFVLLRAFDALPEGWTEAGVTDALVLLGLGAAGIFRKFAKA